MNERTCDHPGCTCAARADGFCSDYCAEHHDDVAAGSAPECHCGHGECVADTAAGPPA